MNAYVFFMENFGKFLLQDEGEPHDLTARVLNESHLHPPPKSAKRLTNTWALIQPGKALLKTRLQAKGITYTEQTSTEVFGEVLDNWDGTPTMFLEFKRTSFAIENLFITVDVRAVRICQSSNVFTFDYTKEPTATSPNTFKSLHKQRMKNAS
ncbi:hypothetical protein N8933_10510 [Pseudomonadales bacterium]|jgi:hypothetical protein|nr:hypothetical protein [Pseudomonadales bacterium]